MIVGTTPMKLFAIMIALNTCSSAMTLVGVFLELGSVMETRIAQMAPMKMTKFANMNVIQRQNFHARMANVFQSYGSAILTMIVEMILMNLLTYAETAIVLVAGEGVQDMPITVAFPNGSSAMAKMIAEMLLTS